MIPDAFRPTFTFDWPVPPIFPKIQKAGGIADDEMRSVFNLGIGIALIANPEDRAALHKLARTNGFDLLDIGILGTPPASRESA